MPALVAGISLRRALPCFLIGMAGTSPAMTLEGSGDHVTVIVTMS
jgi:hypothetical protein